MNLKGWSKYIVKYFISEWNGYSRYMLSNQLGADQMAMFDNSNKSELKLSKGMTIALKEVRLNTYETCFLKSHEFEVKDFEVINHDEKNNNNTITAISTGIIKQIQKENKYPENPILEVKVVIYKWIILTDSLDQIQATVIQGEIPSGMKIRLTNYFLINTSSLAILAFEEVI